MKDNLGSSTLEVNEKGEIVSLEEYAPYGGSTIFIGSGSSSELKHYRYSGKERDSATGFYYYGARYYSTLTARWLSPDPAGPVDGLNIYLFVSGNPVTFVDVDGRGKTYMFAPVSNSIENFVDNAIGTSISQINERKQNPIILPIFINEDQRNKFVINLDSKIFNMQVELNDIHRLKAQAVRPINIGRQRDYETILGNKIYVGQELLSHSFSKYEPAPKLHVIIKMKNWGEIFETAEIRDKLDSNKIQNRTLYDFSEITSKDELIVQAHGNAGSPFIYGDKGDKLEAKRIPKMLKDKKLPNYTKMILNSCYGGSGVEPRSKTQVRNQKIGKPHSQSFLSYLDRELQISSMKAHLSGYVVATEVNPKNLKGQTGGAFKDKNNREFYLTKKETEIKLPAIIRNNKK